MTDDLEDFINKSKKDMIKIIESNNKDDMLMVLEFFIRNAHLRGVNKGYSMALNDLKNEYCDGSEL